MACKIHFFVLPRAIETGRKNENFADSQTLQTFLKAYIVNLYPFL